MRIAYAAGVSIDKLNGTVGDSFEVRMANWGAVVVLRRQRFRKVSR